MERLKVPEPLQSATLSEFIPQEGLMKLLQISRKVLYVWTQKGCPYVRVGAKLFFHAPSVATWLLSRQIRRDPDAGGEVHRLPDLGPGVEGDERVLLAGRDG